MVKKVKRIPTNLCQRGKHTYRRLQVTHTAANVKRFFLFFSFFAICSDLTRFLLRFEPYNKSFCKDAPYTFTYLLGVCSYFLSYFSFSPNFAYFLPKILKLERFAFPFEYLIDNATCLSIITYS